MTTLRLWVLGVTIALSTACGAPKMKCDATTCPFGCCDTSGSCQDGSSAAQCGTQGAACFSCGIASVCQAGVCR